MSTEEYEELRDEWEDLNSEGCTCEGSVSQCDYCFMEAWLELEEYLDLHSPGC